MVQAFGLELWVITHSEACSDADTQETRSGIADTDEETAGRQVPALRSDGESGPPGRKDGVRPGEDEEKA